MRRSREGAILHPVMAGANNRSSMPVPPHQNGRSAPRPSARDHYNDLHARSQPGSRRCPEPRRLDDDPLTPRAAQHRIRRHQISNILGLPSNALGGLYSSAKCAFFPNRARLIMPRTVLRCRHALPQRGYAVQPNSSWASQHSGFTAGGIERV